MEQKQESLLTRIRQIGFIAAEEGRVREGMRAIFGKEPSRTQLTREDDGRRYYNKPGTFQAQLIFYEFDSIEVEFIIPLHGESIWQDFLDEHGEGLHHIQFFVDDCAPVQAYMESLGIPVMQEGNSVLALPGLKWQYYDLGKYLPFVLELCNGVAKGK